MFNALNPIKTTYNPNANFIKKKEDEEQSSHAQEQEQQQSVQTRATNPDAPKFSVVPQPAQPVAPVQPAPNPINYGVNIAQIIKDFKGTAQAIGASPELTEEVGAYLTLIEKESKKPEPSPQLIKSNLKNASGLLDAYISETLQKPSKVVLNWIEALFLQKVDYNYNTEDVNEQFLVQFPEKQAEKEEVEETKQEVVKQNPTVYIPEDSQLKSLFLRAKRLGYAGHVKEAMREFKKALLRAQEVSDNKSQSLVRYEIGKIYDKNDYLAQALTSYNKSIELSDDNNLKTKAHYSMGQIYDDVAQQDPAIDHYMTSISYAGEADNLVAQSTSLTKIANIFADKYDRKAFEFYGEAKIIAKETDNHKAKGFVASNTANAHVKFNEPQKALTNYSEAIKEYSHENSPVKLAMNYQKAGDLMNKLNNDAKAKSLYQKALNEARKTDNVSLMADINNKLKNL